VKIRHVWSYEQAGLKSGLRKHWLVNILVLSWGCFFFLSPIFGFTVFLSVLGFLFLSIQLPVHQNKLSICCILFVQCSVSILVGVFFVWYFLGLVFVIVCGVFCGFLFVCLLLVFFLMLMLMLGCSGTQFLLSATSYSRCLHYLFCVMSNSSTVTSALLWASSFPLNSQLSPFGAVMLTQFC